MYRVLLLGLALSACSDVSVSGSVDGEPVKNARNAIFDEADITIPLLGTQKWMLVVVTDLPDACRVYTDIADNIEFTCEESCEDLGRIATADLGADDYWTLDLAFNADPTRVVGSFAHAGTPGTNQFSAAMSRWQVGHLYDETSCMETCAESGPLPSTDSDGTGGTAEVTRYEVNEALDGTFDLQLGGDELSGSFRADPCPALSDYILWLPE